MRHCERSGRQPVVVYVEDDALIAMMMEEAMEERGFRVHAFDTGEGACAYLRDGGDADVLFTDINLAGEMTGEILARAARGLRPELAVVYASGTQSAVGEAVAGSRFFAKPYSPTRLCDALADIAPAPV